MIPNELPKLAEIKHTKFKNHKMTSSELKNDEPRGKITQLRRTDHYRGKTCWHFLRGFCKRGKSCGFRHSFPDARNRSGKIFPPEMSSHITEDALKKELSDLSFNVIPKAEKLHSSWTQDCLRWDPQVEKGEMLVNACFAGVGPSEEISKNRRLRLIEDTRRSIFLGGLPKGVTGKMIRLALKKLNAEVVSMMRVKRGFCPKVTLSSIHQASRLISEVEIEIGGSMVDVRPYVPRTSVRCSGKRS